MQELTRKIFGVENRQDDQAREIARLRNDLEMKNRSLEERLRDVAAKTGKIDELEKSNAAAKRENQELQARLDRLEAVILKR